MAFSLTQQLPSVSDGNLALLLVMTALASFLLGPRAADGRGLRHSRQAVLAAPALVQAGISPMQAHMFVLFNGILGMVTLPVALAAFAAATIAQSDQWKTGWTAMRLSWCSYFIPFLFAYSPALDHARRSVIDRAGGSHGLARHLHMGTAAVVGYVLARIPVPRRIGYAAIALLPLAQPAMFDGAVYANIIGMIAAAVAIGWKSRTPAGRGPRQGRGWGPVCGSMLSITSFQSRSSTGCSRSPAT